MKSKAIAVLALVSLGVLAFAGAAFAGINPNTAGLPNVDTSLTGGDNNYYANLGAAVPGYRGSVMCVACHTRNPAARTAYRTNKANWNYVGSHFVTRDFNDTAKGGGYTDGTAPKNVRSTANKYIADNASTNNNGGMTIANGWYGAPEYGRLTAGTIDNNWVGTADMSANAAQMICNSCHSIVNNIGPAKLLASSFANGATTSGGTADTKGTVSAILCQGCHGDMNSGINNEWQYHPIRPGDPAWVGTQHHRNTQGTGTAGRYMGRATVYTTNMAAMLRADYTSAQQMWAAGPGTLVDHNPIVYTGSRMKAINDNNQIRPTGPSQLLCTNCHRAHNADSSAGATILMRGYLAINANSLIGNHAVPAGATTAYTGLYRMQEAGGRAAMVNSTNAMCLSCHQ
jgi:hypothetical protein